MNKEIPTSILCDKCPCAFTGDFEQYLLRLWKAAKAHEAACNDFAMAKSSDVTSVRAQAAGIVYERAQDLRSIISEATGYIKP